MNKLKELELRYDEVGDLHYGRSRVRLDSKWGFINYKGDIAIEPQIRFAILYHHHLCSLYAGRI